MDDGRVEAVFEGGRQEIDKMLEWCHQGPPMSHVDHVEVIHEPFTGDQQGFRIVY
jgi:acylphosphatase